MKGIILSPYAQNDQKIQTVFDLIEHTAQVEGIYNNLEHLTSGNRGPLDFIFVFSSFLEKNATQELKVYLEKNNHTQVIFLAEDIHQAALAWPYFPAAFCLIL